MKKRSIITLLMICTILITALSGCKRENAAEEAAVAAAAKSGKEAETGERAETVVNSEGTALPVAAGAGTQTVTEIPAENTPQKEENASVFGNPETEKGADPLPEGETGEKEKHANLRLPEGISFKVLCVEGEYCGTKEEAQYSYGALKGSIPANAEEYVYWFDAAQIKNLRWEDESETVDRFDNRPDCASYSTFMEAFGEDGYIVIGRASGKREGHLAYFADNPIASVGIAIGFTLTDFTVEEVLYGGNLNKKLRVKEDYLFGQYKTKENVLYPTALGEFALTDECRYLLFLKKTKNQESYEIFGGYGGFPLTDDYKKYDQEYLDQLAGFLNMIPEYYNQFTVENLTQYFSYHTYHRNRDPQEALEVNKDDLLVALAQKYGIRIWPRQSRTYEESNLPFSWLAELGCKPDKNGEDS